jgi:hypothetical protein
MSALCHTSVLGRRHQYRKCSKNHIFVKLATNLEADFSFYLTGHSEMKTAEQSDGGVFCMLFSLKDSGTSSKTYLQTNVVLTKRVCETIENLSSGKFSNFD